MQLADPITVKKLLYQVKFGSRSFRVFELKIWSSLPAHIKNTENLFAFKQKMEWCFIQIKCL